MTHRDNGGHRHTAVGTDLRKEGTCACTRTCALAAGMAQLLHKPRHGDKLTDGQQAQHQDARTLAALTPGWQSHACTQDAHRHGKHTQARANGDAGDLGAVGMEAAPGGVGGWRGLWAVGSPLTQV